MNGGRGHVHGARLLDERLFPLTKFLSGRELYIGGMEELV